jgi:hypothetical protein
MARVLVYRFKVWDQARGEHVESERLATRDAIESSGTSELIPDGAIEVDASLLDGNGMTRRLGSPARWAFGAIDDHGKAYVVIESLGVDPRLSREAFPLVGSATLQHAENIAAEFNRHGSYVFRGGTPLVDDQIPRLHRASD